MKVYKLGGGEVEIDRERASFVDRTRIVEGACATKRFYKYHAGPSSRGIDRALKGDDLVLGQATHYALDVLAKGGSSGQAAAAAYVLMKDYENPLLMAGDAHMQTMMPEVYELLKEEQAHLAEALAAAFALRVWPTIVEEYEILGVEEEINWLLADSPPIVVMSRPDGVWRSRTDGKLRAVSYKTTKEMRDETRRRLFIDPQQFTEGLAVQSKYAEPISGTLYFYFLKGKREAPTKRELEYNADLIPYKRYNNPLVRPFINTQMASSGTLGPECFAMKGKWYDPREERERALGKGWERVNVWEHLDMGEWLEWLERGLVQPRLERDWLGEAVVDPIEVPWNQRKADRWVKQHSREEREWVERYVGVEASMEWIGDMVGQNEEECIKYTYNCPMWAICHEGGSVDELLASGRYVPRVANHSQEVGDED